MIVFLVPVLGSLCTIFLGAAMRKERSNKNLIGQLF